MTSIEPRELLPIGVLSLQCGLSIATLRRYDEAGLLRPARVDPDSGYRYYEPAQVGPGHLIRLLRALDVPLATVSELLTATTPDVALARLDEYWHQVERRVAEGRRIKAFLHRSLGGTEFGMFHIEVKDVPEQTVLGRRRVVAIPELVDHIYTSLNQLREEAASSALTVSGPGLTLYYSKVDDETDGEVQVCLPVQGTAEADLSRLDVKTSVDLLPGGTLAYTVASGPEQTEYPAILGAYDAIADWAGGHARVLSGPPREIAHDSHRIEVAWLLADQ